MSWNDQIILDVQQDVHDRLSNDAFFSDIPVILERRGDIANMITKSLTVLNSKSGKMGACVVVLMPEVEVPADEVNSPGPTIEIVQMVSCITNRLFNDGAKGTGKSSEQIACNVINLLHRYIPFHLGHVMVADTRPIRPLDVQGDAVTYLAVTRMRTGFDRVQKVVTPKVDQVDGKVVLSTSTVGAEIYYTTNGSYPGPANEAAVKYTAPFEPPLPVTLRVTAYATNYIPSDTLAGVID